MSRRRAEKHRKATAAERVGERQELERQWYEKHDNEDDVGKERALILDPTRPGLTRQERADFRQEEEVELEPPKERCWRRPRTSLAQWLKAKIAYRHKREMKLREPQDEIETEVYAKRAEKDRIDIKREHSKTS